MGRRVLLLLVALGLLGAIRPTVVAQEEPEFIITIDSYGHPLIDAPIGMVTLREEDPANNSYVLDFALSKAYTVGEVRFSQAVPVDRAKQFVPRVDDSAQHPTAAHVHPHFFVEVPRDVHETDAPTHLANLTGQHPSYTTQLGLVGPGASVLLLDRDMTPPTFAVGAPADATHFSFLLETTTNEFALASLYIRPASGSDEVEHSTSSAALTQTFPVQGLEPETDYVYRLAFRDWGGNEARTGEYAFRTLPEPVHDPPVLVSQEPLPQSTVDAVTRVAATFTSPTPIELSGIQFFLDKLAVPEGFTVEALGNDTYEVAYRIGAPLTPGDHEANFEATNLGGGETKAVWRFTVAGGDAPGLGFVALLGLVVMVVAMRRTSLP